jgi:hypothetical protein
VILSFAEGLKRCASEWFGWDGKKDERGRRLLQTLGTDAGRHYDPEIWVRMWKARAWALLATGNWIVADDVRFENEAAAVRELGGLVVMVTGRVETMAGATAEHVSELGVKGDVEVLNYAGRPLASVARDVWGLMQLMGRGVA